MKKCIGCNEVLTGKKLKWCSDECNKKNYKRATKTGTCQECKKEFEYPEYETNRKFCSKSCVGKENARRNNAPRIAKRVTLTCKHCKKEYKRSPFAAKNSKYCSRSCQKDFSAPVELVCSQCGGSYKRIPAAAARSSYCSRICQNIHQSRSQGKGSDSKHYKNGLHCYRQIAMEFYGGSCKVCGESGDIHIHHKDSDRKNNDIRNLVPLCHKCHSSLHRIADLGVKFSSAVEACPTPEYYATLALPLIEGRQKKIKEKKEKEIDL